MADYAGVGSRIVAIIIDTIILWIIAVIIAIPLGLLSAFTGMMTDVTAMMNLFANAAIWGTFTVVNAIIWILYFSYFESTSGQTPGKRAMSIKVTKEDGSKATFVDALVRTILRIIDGIFFYILGLIIILVTEKKQRLGDILARTIVVKA
ncbi:MAG: hypothetical protein GTN38_02210 [Candidatus Aenigmarchaeota archaeon]|nr:hypothetical protein [Candidatus Aenigmarchaeota archaeon]NIP40367.1 hypothetical protein [Candidatus Aenigmarchaeota archaeon]NIQ18293.1 hypothetical protein [Candidatus Aenigmarchaeota archaeon]NIS73245.1 hypothetical protein [Candidatus Aenigmarchaeota archaeon]